MHFVSAFTTPNSNTATMGEKRVSQRTRIVGRSETVPRGFKFDLSLSFSLSLSLSIYLSIYLSFSLFLLRVYGPASGFCFLSLWLFSLFQRPAFFPWRHDWEILLNQLKRWYRRALLVNQARPKIASPLVMERSIKEPGLTDFDTFYRHNDGVTRIFFHSQAMQYLADNTVTI